MITKRLWIALTAIPICLASILVTSAERSHLASAAGSIDPSCTSANPCIEYDNNGSGPGVRGVSLSGNGLNGITRVKSTSAANGREGVFGNDLSTSGIFNSGVTGGSLRGTGVTGYSTSGTGVVGIGAFGSQSYGSSSGTFVEGGTTGAEIIETSMSTSSEAVQVVADGGRLFRGENGNLVNVFTVEQNGDIHITGKIFTSGSCSTGCAASASPGYHVVSYAPQESLPTMEDTGEAQLVNGDAYVRLDPAFASVIDRTANYIVLITPEGDSRGLYVAQKSRSGFAVRENGRGRSTLGFSYRIVAKPYGPAAARLPMVYAPKNYLKVPHESARQPVLLHGLDQGRRD